MLRNVQTWIAKAIKKNPGIKEKPKIKQAARESEDIICLIQKGVANWQWSRLLENLALVEYAS